MYLFELRLSSFFILLCLDRFLKMQAYFIILLVYLAVLGLCWRAGFSRAAASRGYSLVAVCGPLTAVPSLAVEHGPLGAQASVVAVPRL